MICGPKLCERWWMPACVRTSAKLSGKRSTKMARKIDSRLKINCTLVARTPLHVGGMGGSVDTDLALAVNGQGDFYIPGTSLAGALRGWLLTGADDMRRIDVERLWGYQK